MQQLKIGVFIYPPYVNDCNISTIVHNYDFPCQKPGIGIEITNEICRHLNFSCQFHYVASTEFGSLLSDGKWTGMLGGIFNGTFDTSFPQFSPNAERMKSFAMTRPFLYPETAFLIKNPSEKDVSGGFLTALFPFEWHIGALVLLTILIVSGLYTWYETREWGIQKIIGYRRTKSRNHSLICVKNLIDTFVIVIDKGEPAPMLKSASYVLIGVWSLIAVVLISMYSANLLSYLMATNSGPPFRDIPTFADCVSRGDCTWVTFSLAQNKYAAIKAAEKGDYYRLKLALENNPPKISALNETLSIISGTKDHYFVFWQSEFSAIDLVRYNCSFLIIPDQSIDMLAFPFAKRNKNLADFFNSMQSKFAETGIVERIVAKYIPQRVCESHRPNEGPTVGPFPLRSMMGPSFVLLCGFFIGLLVLVCEFHIKKRRLEQD